MLDTSHKRHLAKSITWRIVGTLDTFILSWIITGNVVVGLKIGLSEIATKMVLYYFHERIWFKVNLPNSNKRHIFKTFSWRVVGTLDTFVLAWIITGSPFTGLKIGIVEIITKMIFYYLHEKIWYRIDFGLEKRYKEKKWEKT